MMRDEWDKLGIRMSKEGEVKGEWLIHESSDKIGFSCFDVEENLVWIVKGINRKKAIRIVEQKALEILKSGLWGDKRVRNIINPEVENIGIDQVLEEINKSLEFVEIDNKRPNVAVKKGFLLMREIRHYHGISHIQVENILKNIKKKYLNQIGD